jgi:Alkylmercury lyase
MDIWSAPPFSAVPTPFRVRSGGMSWYAPCAWDAFGIPAALKRDTTCEAACAWSGEPLHTGVRAGAAFGDGVIHLLVARRGISRAVAIFKSVGLTGPFWSLG